MINYLEKVHRQIDVYMKIAEVSSHLSKDHSKLGCLAIHKNRIVGVGVNGYISGYDDKDKCGKHAKVIHAEMNAILNAKQDVEVLVVYGLPPCQDCMKFMIAYGVKRCYWKLNESIESHKHWMTNHRDHRKWHRGYKDFFVRVY